MFYVIGRKRRDEFGWGIVDERGKEVHNFANEEDARSIVRIMNANCLSAERIAAVEVVSKESIREEHLQAVLTAREWRSA